MCATINPANDTLTSLKFSSHLLCRRIGGSILCFFFLSHSAIVRRSSSFVLLRQFDFAAHILFFLANFSILHSDVFICYVNIVRLLFSYIFSLFYIFSSQFAIVFSLFFFSE